MRRPHDRRRRRPLLLSAAAAVALCAPLSGMALARGGDDDPPGREHQVEIDDFRFTPSRTTARPGQLVVWKNSDRAPHNATATRTVKGRPAFATRTGGRGARLTAHAPKRTGRYGYICTVHPRMKGVLVVAR